MAMFYFELAIQYYTSDFTASLAAKPRTQTLIFWRPCFRKQTLTGSTQSLRSSWVFFMASGHVTWLRGREGLTIRYSGITFTRRDIPFLEFLADALRSIGFDRVQLARIHLTIYSTPTNNKLLTNAISIYREHNIPFDQKLSLLDTLLSGKEVLLKDVMNQMTFYDFLGYENLENAFARVIAQ